MTSTDEILSSSLIEHSEILTKVKGQTIPIVAISNAIVSTLKAGGKVMICGNGGSAADSQHFAAELTGRYKKERRALAAIALHTDTSALTAISNDYAYDKVFSRQVEALGKKGDALVIITTSGNSPNLLEAARKAKELDITVIGLLGKGGGKAKDLCDLSFIVPSDNTPRIQEMHILTIHIICEIIDNSV